MRFLLSAENERFHPGTFSCPDLQGGKVGSPAEEHDPLDIDAHVQYVIAAVCDKEWPHPEALPCEATHIAEHLPGDMQKHPPAPEMYQDCGTCSERLSSQTSAWKQSRDA